MKARISPRQRRRLLRQPVDSSLHLCPDGRIIPNLFCGNQWQKEDRQISLTVCLYRGKPLACHEFYVSIRRGGGGEPGQQRRGGGASRSSAPGLRRSPSRSQHQSGWRSARWHRRRSRRKTLLVPHPRPAYRRSGHKPSTPCTCRHQSPKRRSRTTFPP